jgi:DNA polymerase-3 subunit delta
VPLDSFGVTVKFDPIDRRNLPQWIAQRLQQQGQRVAGGRRGQRIAACLPIASRATRWRLTRKSRSSALLHPTGEQGALT